MTRAGPARRSWLALLVMACAACGGGGSGGGIFDLVAATAARTWRRR